MGWEYEDLFNNRITGDGSFLEEPSFIQVGKMGYRRRTTVSGPRIDAEVFPVFGRSQRGELRRARHQITREAQKRANDERSRLHLIQLVEANFTEKDVSSRNFIGRVKRARARAGLGELKYIYAIGGDEMPAAGYSGKRPHVHMILNGGIDRDALERIWGKGRANADRLQPRSDGLGGIGLLDVHMEGVQVEPHALAAHGAQKSEALLRRVEEGALEAVDHFDPQGDAHFSRPIAYAPQGLRGVLELFLPGKGDAGGEDLSPRLKDAADLFHAHPFGQAEVGKKMLRRVLPLSGVLRAEIAPRRQSVREGQLHIQVPDQRGEAPLALRRQG